jgi:hypothetical protein
MINKDSQSYFNGKERFVFLIRNFNSNNRLLDTTLDGYKHYLQTTNNILGAYVR